MRLTTKGRFAVTAVLDLHMHEQGHAAVTLSSISKRQDISLSYLEQLFSRLRHRGIVVSARGPGGGYRLARAASEISVAEIVQAVDEHIDATLCSGQRNCQGTQPCMTHNLWEGLSQHIYAFLSSVNLETLREQAQKKGRSNQKMRAVVQNSLSNREVIKAAIPVEAPRHGGPISYPAPDRRYYGGGSDNLPR